MLTARDIDRAIMTLRKAKELLCPDTLPKKKENREARVKEKSAIRRIKKELKQK